MNSVTQISMQVFGYRVAWGAKIHVVGLPTSGICYDDEDDDDDCVTNKEHTCEVSQNCKFKTIVFFIFADKI